MPSPLSLLASLSFAISAVPAWAQSVSSTGQYHAWEYTCPPPSTVSINITEYVPVTSTSITTASYFSTTTQPITIYQTIISISTTVVTSTEKVTETSTVTTVSTSPTTDTATATEIIFPYTTTEEVTSITLCPTRIVNPTFTALGPYPTDWTWGCPPGWLCKPLRDNCNFEAGLPDRNFYCSPDECIPADALPATLPTWDTNIYGNSTPAENAGLTINAIDSYFNVAPGDFGLNYQIFVIDEVFTLTSTTLILPTPTVAARQAQTSVPGACYPWCNNCLLEAQANGKTSALCVPGSAFEVSMEQCEQCIQVHKRDDTGSFVQIAPQFQQFLDYCDQFATVVVTTSIMTTATNDAGSTYGTVTPTLSTTVTPKASTSSPPAPPPPSSTSTGGPKTTTSTKVTNSTVTPSSSPPPSPYTTTSTVETTIYSQSTLTGPAWSQITIIMPIGPNSTTTTLYGSTLTDNGNGPTLVLPVGSPTTSSYVTTLTITPTATTTTGAQAGSVSPSPSPTGSSSSSGTATPSTFPGAAAATSRLLAPGEDGTAFLARSILLYLGLPLVLTLGF